MDHADECLSFLLRLSGVWCEIKAEGRSLLRLLQLRISAMPTCSDGVTVLFLKFPDIDQLFGAGSQPRRY